MADDVSANINVNFDTKEALRNLRQLQAGLSKFNQALTQGNVAAANAQKGLTDQLIQSINATGRFVASQKQISTSTKQFTDALEKNKLSLREYWRYTAATATQNSKVFSKAWASEREVITRAAKDRVKLLQSQYIQLNNANGEFVKVLQIVPKHLRTVNGQITDYATKVQMAAQRQQFLNQLIKQGSTQLLNWGKNTQWAGRQLMVGLTIPLTMLGSTASRVFMDMEMALLKFQKVYGDTFTSTDSLNAATENLKKLALEFTKYGVSVTDTIQMASSAAAMGLTGTALTQQVTAATKLAVLGQVEQQQALETTISLQNAFGLSTDQLAQKINFLNAVENQTVLSIEDLTIAVPKAGPVIKQLGGSVEDLAFFMTAMKEGGINASEGANALKSGLASLINPSDKASKMLAGLGINIKGIVEANAGDLKGTVVGFARALDTLDPLNRARAIEQLFGKFQFARLSTLFQNVAKDGTQAARAFELAGKSVEELAILSERELGKTENAVTNKFRKSVEQLKVSLVPLGKTFLEALTPVVQFLGKLLDKFNNLSAGTKKAITIITVALGAIAPVALMSIGLVANGVANLVKFFGLLRGGMAKLNGQNQVLGGGFDYLTQQEIENLAETNALHTSHQQLIATFNVEKATLDALARAYANAGSQARALASAAPGLFNTVPGAVGAVSGLPPKKFASGGVVPGTGNGDTVPAMLTPGEVVLTKDTVKNNPELVAALVNGSVKKYVDGTGKMPQTSSFEGAIKRGATPDYIQKEYDRIARLTDAQLKRYAELTGVGVDKSLEEVRSIVLQNFEELLADVKSRFGKVSQEGITAVGKKFDPSKGYSPMGAWFSKFDQQQKEQFSHVGQAEVVTMNNLKSMQLTPEAQKGLSVLESLGLGGKDFRVADAFGFGLKGTINRGMASASSGKSYEAKNGVGSLGKDFITDFEKRGASKWKDMTNIVGADFDSLSAEIQVYDDALLNKVKAWQEQNMQKPIPEIFNDQIFKTLEAEVSQEIGQLIPEFSKVIETAKTKITAIRMSLNEQELQAANARAAEVGLGDSFFGTKTQNTKISNVEARTAGQVLGTKTIEGVNEGAGTASPSKKSKKTGNDIADGLIIGMEEKQGQVKSQADRLAESALPGKKVDRTNQAFYNDINTPEMRDQRQVLKSLDRRRRKMGAKGRIPTPINTTTAELQGELSVTVSSTKKTKKASDALATQMEQSAQNAQDQNAIAKTTTSVMEDVAQTTSSSATTIADTSNSLLTQNQIADAITSTDQNIVQEKQQTLQTQEQINAEKQKEYNAAVQSASNEMANANIPDGSQAIPGDPGFIGPLNESQQREKDLIDKRNARLDRKKALAEKRGQRRMAVGKYSGKISGGLGAAAMVAGMTGAPAAVTGALGTASMVSSMAPMLAGLSGPQAIGVGLIAAAAGLKLFNDHLKKTAAQQAKYIDSVSAGTEKMKKIGELTGKVGASEIMSKRRQGNLFDEYTKPRERKGQPFGETFLGSDVGKQIQTSFVSNMNQVGSKKAAEQFALELGAYISDGVLTAEQANSVAQSIGTKLGDMTIAANIEGNLRMLVGPGGEDILKNPIDARVNLVTKSGQLGEELKKAAEAENKKTTLGEILLFGSGYGGMKEAAQMAAADVKTVELAQAQSDAVAKIYDDKLRTLEAEKAATTNKQKQLELDQQIAELQSQSADATGRMNNLVSQSIEKAMANFKSMQTNYVGFGGTESGAFDSVKSMVKDKYANTEFKTMANDILSRMAKISDNSQFGKQGFGSARQAQQFEYKVDFLMANGILNPQQTKTMLDLFDGNLSQLETNLDIGIRTQGGAKTAALINMFSGMKNKNLAQTFIANIVRKSPQEFDKTAKALDMMTKLDGVEINMSVALEKMGVQGLTDLSNRLNEIQSITSPITKEVITKLMTTDAGGKYGDLQHFIDNYKEWGNLPDNVKKQALQLYTTIYSSMFLDDVARKQWIENYAREKANKASQGGKITYMYEYVYKSTVEDFNKKGAAGQSQTIAEQQAKDYIKWQQQIDAATAKSTATEKGKKATSFLDDLAQRFKNVRDGAFNAMTPLKSMLALFNNKAKKNINDIVSGFDGLQQRLIKMNVPKEFRDYISSLSNEDFATLANLKGDKAIFNFEKGKPKTKANITGLTDTGNKLMQFYRETQIGETNVANQDKIKDIEYQNKAFNMLVASGMSADKALEQVQDTAIAAAIAMGAAGQAGSKEMNQFIKDSSDATDAQKKFEVISNVIRKNEEFRAQQTLPKLASALKGLGYSTDQINEVLSDPDLAKQLTDDLKDGKIDAKEIADYINSIPAKKIIEIQTNINKGDYAAAAQQGMDYVDRLFQVQENLIRTGADPRSEGLVADFKKNEAEIKDKTKQVDALRKEIDGLQKDINNIQRDIEEQFNKPIERIQKQIDLNQRALEVGGQYKVNGKDMVLPYKLSNRYMETLNVESNKLSNDLTIIGHQSDEINKKYDQQAEALQKVREINDQITQQQKDQLDLASAITSGDISAAARAAQQSRAGMAATYQDQQSAALEQARKNELGALTGAETGLTQEQIQERQYQIQQELYRIETSPERLAIKAEQTRLEDEIYKLEQARQVKLDEIAAIEDKIYKIQKDKLEPLENQLTALQEANDKIQEQIDKLVENIRVQGMSKDEWEKIKAKIDASALASENMDTALAGLLAATQAINAEWASILAKLASYKDVSSGIKSQADSFTDSKAKDDADAAAAKAKADAEAKAKADAEAGKTATQKQIDSLTEMRNQVDKGSALGFKLKEQIDELKSTGGSLFSRIPVVDEQTKIAAMRAIAQPTPKPTWTGFRINDRSSGGLIKYYKNGGIFKPIGTDTVPAMLTPGEFIMSKYAVDSYGLNTMKAINNGDPVGDSVYNYSINVNVKSDANPDEIARAVMTHIERVNSQNIRSVRI